MSGWWVQRAFESGGAVELFAWIFWVIGSIVLHELAHGWAALWQGDDTPRRLDRLTLNPLVHMGPYSLLMFAIVGFAWGLMPTDPSQYRSRRWGSVLVAAAGPAMNVALAFLCLTALAFVIRFGDSETTSIANLQTFLYIGGFINIVLMVLNLLPIPPLDGSVILAGFSQPYRRLLQHPNAPMIGFGALVILLFSGLLGAIWTPFIEAGEWWVGTLASALGEGPPTERPR